MNLGDLWWTYEDLIVSIGINGLLALSVYLVLTTGQLFLAQSAFMAVGAYTAAALALDTHLPMWVSMLAAISVGGLASWLLSLPMLRLSGVYMGIATIAFGEVLRTVVVNTEALGGALGLNGIPMTAGAGLIFGILLLAVVGLLTAMRCKVGRALETIRTDETAAQVLGINVVRYKTVVIIVSSMLAACAGALNAYSHSSISPSDFSFEATVTILSFAIVGGTASPVGAVAGALVLTILPEILRDFAQYRPVINGLLIVGVVAFRPEGLVAMRIARGRRHA